MALEQPLSFTSCLTARPVLGPFPLAGRANIKASKCEAMSYRRDTGRPLKFKSVNAIQKKIDAYFAACKKEKRPYTITGLALALDTSRRTLLNYQDNDKYFHTIKKAKLKIQSWTEEQLYRTTQVTGVIFNLKNNYGWKDKLEHELSGDVKADMNVNFVKVDDAD